MVDNDMEERRRVVSRIACAWKAKPGRVAIRNARKIDARGVRDHFWVVCDGGVILATGNGDDDYESCRRAIGFGSADIDSSPDAAVGATADVTTIDAKGALLTPGYIDIHSHGAWGSSFDDGPQGIAMARAGHIEHGTTRQVLSLITNPIPAMVGSIGNVYAAMGERPDILGSHLEGPFLAPSRRGAHNPADLKDPAPDVVDALLDASRHSIRQITIAPELEHGIDAIRRFRASGVVPAIGHCDADYDTALRGFDAGAQILTHVFNAMNGIHHRAPGPIPAAVEDPRVTIELINDGFHVHDPVVRLAFDLAPHRIALVTDAMAATGCPDGAYKLGSLDVNVIDGHARLASNGAIAGSTLVLEEAVRRAVMVLGMDAVESVEAATLTPARALGLDGPNPVTGAPLGLIAPGYAADMLLTDRNTWNVMHVWCAGHRLK